MTMTIKVHVIIACFIVSCFAQSFLDQQRKAPRFQNAEKDKRALVTELFKSKGLEFPNVDVFIRVFKNEESLELWAKPKQGTKCALIRTYKICSSSGNLGPKRRQGDGQVPEGCYYINRFNPYSNYYLSLGISYPNESDKITGGKGNLGGDIFIHGDCVTIGCIPITNYYIEELYLICAYAKNGGRERIPVHIFPIRMNVNGMAALKKYFAGTTLISFWENLKHVYDKFENTHEFVKYDIDDEGNYTIK
jgi:murein L,D-transpeptidase YafK